MKASWKTTLFALVAAAGAAILGAYELKPALLAGFPTWLPGVGLLASVVGTACVGVFARDNNVTSEQAGAAPTVTEPGVSSQATKIPIVFLSLALLTLPMGGCVALDPGVDPLEVRAEQSVSLAGDTFDTFLKLEYDEISLVRSNAPAVHQFAEWLRQPVTLSSADTNAYPRDIAMVLSANQARAAYKANRSAENKASLVSVLAALEEALRQTQAQMAAIKK